MTPGRPVKFETYALGAAAGEATLIAALFFAGIWRGNPDSVFFLVLGVPLTLLSVPAGFVPYGLLRGLAPARGWARLTFLTTFFAPCVLLFNEFVWSYINTFFYYSLVGPHSPSERLWMVWIDLRDNWSEILIAVGVTGAVYAFVDRQASAANRERLHDC